MTNTSQPVADVPPPGVEQESSDAHGKFSLNEDWLATIAGLILLVACLSGIVPDIGEWF
ncbi:hypothetical protein [Corynebacterium camporealensis]